jgi:hypothetical protein
LEGLPWRGDGFAAEYQRLFGTLTDLAAELDVPSDDAEEIIAEVLMSTLTSRHITDVDTWVKAAFTRAVGHRGEHAC